MIALQAFYFFEIAIEDIAAKLVCGASYCDGSAAIIIHPARSIDDALLDMRTVGRPKAKGILKWNKTADITDNVRHVMAATDNFCVACRNHSARLNEIRHRRLGAMPQRIPRAGAFVLREFTPGVPLLLEFLATLAVVIKDAAKC
jgi:hypothetical protein